MNKPKRKLTDIDFSNEGAHIALCHKDQGVASQADFALVLKADYSDEFIQKLQTVRVELELPDFIQAFWKIEEEQDAKALAYLMGWREDLTQEAKEPEMDFQDWVESNMESFEVVKALKYSDNYAKILANLDEHQYLSLLQDQQRFEKGLKRLEAEKQAELAKAEYERKKPKVVKTQLVKESNPAASATEFDASTSTVQHEVNKGKGVNPVVKPKAKKETLMANKENEKQETKAEFTVVEKQVEMIEKSQFEAILKQMQDMKAQAEQQQVELQKAKEQVEKFEQERKEVIEKQRLADIEAAVKNKEHAAVLHKALKQAEQAEFSEVVKALAAISLPTMHRDLFVEKSAAVQDKPEVEESAIAKALRARLQK